jgi:hypothetical protein
VATVPQPLRAVYCAYVCALPPLAGLPEETFRRDEHEALAAAARRLHETMRGARERLADAEQTIYSTLRSRPMQYPERVNYEQAAEMIGISPRTLRNWTAAGRVPPDCVRRIGRFVRGFDSAKLAMWIDAGCPPRVKEEAGAGRSRD